MLLWGGEGGGRGLQLIGVLLRITPPICNIVCRTGLQRLMESYTRLQQLRGLPASVPSNAAASLQQTSKVRGRSCSQLPCICFTAID